MALGFVMLLMVSPVALPVVLFVRLIGRVMFSEPVRPWATAAVYAPLGAALMYLWGIGNSFAWDVGATCTNSGQTPDQADRCYEYHTQVPVYVNPAIVVLLASTVLFIGLAIRASVLSRRPVG